MSNKVDNHDVLYYSLRPLDRQKPFPVFFSQYISTRITCFGALALVTCCCLLYQTK